MDNGKIPPFECFTDPATLGRRWTRWLTSFELFADGKGLIVEPNTPPATLQRRRALLLHHAGQDVQDIFLTLANRGGPAEYDLAVAALNNYFVPRVNVTFARQEFHTVTQKQGETTQQFITRLRQAARDCAFGVDMENQIRDAVMARCSSSYVRRKLLEEGHDLDLDRAIEVCELCERVEQQMSLPQDGAAAPSKADTVNRIGPKGGNAKFKHKQQTPRKSEQRCFRCGNSGHFGKDSSCPARGKTCHKCGGKDHFSKVCKTKKQSVNNVTAEAADYAFIVKSSAAQNSLNVCLGGVQLNVLIDSGATCNIVDEGTWEGLKKQNIQCQSYVAGAEKKLYAYSSTQPLPVKGAFKCEVTIGNASEQAEFIVIQGHGESLLGRETATKLGVLRIGTDIAAVQDLKQSMRSQYPDVFQGVGKLNTKQVSLYVNPDAQPVAQPLRRIPFNLRGPLERKIKELLDMDIIEEVNGPTPWVNPVVVVPKTKTEIRLCLDMRRANQAIVRERYPIPTVDEVLQSMNGSKIFSKLDLKWGYHQLELTPASRQITTFATHNGIYRYKRLLFGVSSASEQYQHEIASALAGIEGVDNISDDIIVHAADPETHNQRLHAVMKRLQQCGLTLNADKCEFSMDRLVFMGVLLTDKGIGPTAERVRAIAEAREPENASEVRSFLGLVSYSSRFIPDFATVAEPLRRLIRKDTTFVFGEEQRKSFSELKAALAKAGTLAYFDKDAPTRVIADASPVGLGAVLVQRQQGEMVPICYVSRSLSDCEKRYSQTEREALALVWACERLHPYVYGRQFDLVTDHKPLEAIYGPRSKPSARVERWVLRLQPYNFKVVHVAGKHNIADSLSRLMGETALRGKHAHEAEEYVRFVAVNATPLALTTREVEEASRTDQELIEVRNALKTGHFQKCMPYASAAAELCVIGYIVLRGTRIVLPRALRARALTLAHEGHLGIVGTKQHLRSKVWWPGMAKAAEKHCKECHGCQITARPDEPEPLRPTVLPDGPWQALAVDLLGPLPSKHSILVTVDYYSRYYEYEVLTSTTTDKIIDSLENMFSRHGLPLTLKSDHGPQFKSDEFRDYCAEKGIEHLKTTPKWAQANGEVERQNSSLMKRIRIAQSAGLDWQKELRRYVTVYRSIAHSTTGKSPAELLFNRKMRGKLPELHPTFIDFEVRDRDAEQKQQHKLYADDRRNAEYSEVAVGDKVLLKQEKVDKFSTNFNKTPHTVVHKHGNQVTVESPEGAQYSRNTTWVKKYNQPQAGEREEASATADPGQQLVMNSRDCPAVPAVPDAPATPASRPQRQRKPPERLKDFVIT